MARRDPIPVPARKYMYEPDPTRGMRTALQVCENPANETKGLHLARVKQWPPKRTRAGEANPYISTLCVRCGSNLLVYGDNEPQQSSIEVEVIQPEKRAG